MQSKKLNLDLPGRLDVIRGATASVCAFAENFIEKFEFKLDGLALCVSEALTNGIVHGNLEMPTMGAFEGDLDKFYEEIERREKDEKYKDRRIQLCCEFSEKEMLFLTISDEGSGFDISSLATELDIVDLDSSGRGLYLIKRFMDHVEWNETGSEMRMLKKLSSK